jgi:hypothetical protein
MMSLTFGMVDQSFRLQSTAGLFGDDYDLLFDPGRILEIQGSRLWTNLANLVNTYETPFNNGSVPYILIGGVTKLGQIYPALVYDRSNRKIAQATGIDDVNGYEIYGDAVRTTIDWNDLDGNGSYDQRLVSTRTASAYDNTQTNDIYLAAASKFSNIRLGLGFLHEEYKDIFTDPDNNFSFDTTAEDLTGPAPITVFEANGGFGGDQNYNYSDNDIRFSGWLDQEKVSFGLNASFDMSNNTVKALILGDTAIHTNPADTTVFHTAANVLDSTDSPWSGTNIDVELKAFYNYNANAQGRFYLGFFTESYNYSSGAREYYHKGRLASYTTFTWDTTNTWTIPSGGGNEKGISLGTRHLFTVSEKLKFGIGLLFSTASYYDSTAEFDTSMAIQVYDDNDGISFDPNDYRRETWSTETWMTRTTGRTHNLTIPVGVEFYLAQPLVFRLGAEHSYTLDDYTTIENQIQYTPTRVRTVDGTGTVTETVIDPGPAPIGSEQTHFDKTPVTNYYYGIGWNVTDNLQIDLMGFAKLTDLSLWRLSATLKF